MNIFDKKTVRDALPYDQLIEALRKAFMEDVIVPHRTHHVIENKGESDASLLLMPAWSNLENIGIKIVSVFSNSCNFIDSKFMTVCCLLPFDVHKFVIKNYHSATLGSEA